MNFLAPLFALGALGIAAPILFHLIRRTTREKTLFSTLMFLQPSPPRITKRSRLENLWLLLLRCLVLALLALAFARPFLPRATPAPPAGTGQRTVLLIDTSASLRRESLWADAQKKAEARLRAAQPGDEMAVVTFDRATRTLMSFEEWRTLAPEQRAATAAQRLATQTPSWQATHLDSALLSAVEALDQAGSTQPGRREIVIISDLQEGARLDGLQGYQWPRGLTVTLDPVTAKARQNASVQWISESEAADQPGEAAPLRLRVNNAPGAKSDQLQLAWRLDSPAPNTAPGKPIEAYVPAGQSRIVKAPTPPAGATALLLTGDDTAFDNTLYLLPPQVTPLPVLFVGPDADEDTKGSLYYLRRAFPKTTRQNVEIIAHRGEETIPGFQLEQAQLLILGDETSEAPLTAARQFAQQGKIVLAPLTSTASATTLGRLLEIPSLTATEAPIKNYALLAQIDFQHPIFAAFADPRFSDFTKIHWWKHRQLDPAALKGARVLASFDSGDPAIVQMPLGKGSVIILTSSWRPTDSQLALSSKFVPLLQAMLELSSNLPPQKAQYFVGDEVPLPSGTEPLVVRAPSGAQTTVQPGAKFGATEEPGIYYVTPGTLRFVVNLAPDESRLTPVTPDRLQSLGVPLRKEHESAAETAKREGQAQATEIENQQKLWRWLIGAALLVLLLETLFAGRLSRPASSSSPAASTT